MSTQFGYFGIIIAFIISTFTEIGIVGMMLYVGLSVSFTSVYLNIELILFDLGSDKSFLKTI